MIYYHQPEDISPLISEDINNMDHSSLQNTIVSLPLNQSSQDQEDSQISKYQALSEFLIAKLNRRYDLRPRSGPSRPLKNPIVSEPQNKSIETQTTTIQPLNQIVETTPFDKTALTTFNVERELERIKIPIHLSEISNNLG